MKTAKMLILGLVVIVAMWTFSTPARATSSGDETITFRVTFSNGQPSSTWSASGVFLDSGTVTPVKRQFHALPSPVTATEQVVDILNGTNGTFTMGFEKVFGHGVPGRWAIRDGTGNYATLHGEGTWTAKRVSVNPLIIIVTCEGQVHFD